MLMSMNVFHQTTPKLFSVSSQGRRRRIPHSSSSSSHALVSSPATAVKFNPKFLHFHGIQHSSCKPVLPSPATMGFNPKSLPFPPCHGFSHSLETMKSCPVLSALPRDNQEFSSDSEEPIIQEHDEEHRFCKPLLASPATMGFSPKSLHSLPCHGFLHSSSKAVLASPATMGFNLKSLHFLPCHGFSHSSCKLVLVSPETMKFSPVLFALPTDKDNFPFDSEEFSLFYNEAFPSYYNEQFPSDNEEGPIIQEHEEKRTSILSDIVNEAQSKKVSGGEVEKLEVREATPDEFLASARLRAEEFYGDLSHGCSDIAELVKQEYIDILARYDRRPVEPFMCIIAVRKEGGNVLNVVGTLDFYDIEREETYPKKVVKDKMTKTFEQREPQKYGRITNVAVAKSARKQGIGSSMLKFAIEYAKENGIPQICVYPDRDNKPALELYRKMGFTIHAVLEKYNQYLCCLNL